MQEKKNHLDRRDLNGKRSQWYSRTFKEKNAFLSHLWSVLHMKGGWMNAWLRQVKRSVRCYMEWRTGCWTMKVCFEKRQDTDGKQAFVLMWINYFLSQMCMQTDFFLINTRSLLCHEFLSTNGAVRVSLSSRTSEHVWGIGEQVENSL